MRTATDEPSATFRIKPAGPFMLRDYTNEDPADLTALRDLTEEILTQHKMLIPGSMNRLMRQWNTDLTKGIKAHGSNAENAEDAP